MRNTEDSETVEGKKEKEKWRVKQEWTGLLDVSLSNPFHNIAIN